MSRGRGGGWGQELRQRCSCGCALPHGAAGGGALARTVYSRFVLEAFAATHARRRLPGAGRVGALAMLHTVRPDAAPCACIQVRGVGRRSVPPAKPVCKIGYIMLTGFFDSAPAAAVWAVSASATMAPAAHAHWLRAVVYSPYCIRCATGSWPECKATLDWSRPLRRGTGERWTPITMFSL